MDDSRDWITGSEEEVVGRAAAFVTAEACRAMAERGRFTLVLAGGNTPKALYRLLARGIPPAMLKGLDGEPPQEWRRSPDNPELATLPWRHTLLFLGDERYVPEGHPDSNYGMVREQLIRHICIPPQNIAKMPVDAGDAADDARRYETMLRSLFRLPDTHGEAQFPSFDLVILGLGDDGHTASLFPDDRSSLEEARRWVVAAKAPDAKPPIPRLTITLPVINHASRVMFLVPGSRHDLARSIRDGLRPDLPAGMVRPEKRPPLWFVAGTPA